MAPKALVIASRVSPFICLSSASMRRLALA